MSVAAKWFLPEEQEDHARRVLTDADVLLAPDLLRVELANVLWKAAGQGRLDPEQAVRILDGMDDQPLDVRAAGPLLPRALRLAIQLRHPVYDCVYIALAEREDCKVVTADRRLHDRVEGSALSGRTALLEVVSTQLTAAAGGGRA